jgi:hypothetical protein
LKSFNSKIESNSKSKLILFLILESVINTANQIIKNNENLKEVADLITEFEIQNEIEDIYEVIDTLVQENHFLRLKKLIKNDVKLQKVRNVHILILL